MDGKVSVRNGAAGRCHSWGGADDKINVAGDVIQHRIWHHPSILGTILCIEPEGLIAGRRRDLPLAIAGPVRTLNLLEVACVFGS